jgi:hypothetical protein
MSITLIGGSETIVSSDAEFQAANASLKTEATMDEAEDSKKKRILVKGMFKVESYKCRS